MASPEHPSKKAAKRLRTLFGTDESFDAKNGSCSHAIRLKYSIS